MAQPMPTRVFLSSAGAPKRIFPSNHPRTHQRIMLARSPTAMLELNLLAPQSAPRASWLLEHDAVLHDGSLYLATPIDPLFLVLPQLDVARAASAEHRGFFKPFSHTFASESAALEGELLQLPLFVTEQLSCICDVKDHEHEPIVRLNDDKVRSWLRRKTARLVAHLRGTADEAEAASAATDASAAQFAPEDDLASQQQQRPADRDEKHLLGALALLCEYLQPKWAKVALEAHALAHDALIAAARPAAAAAAAPEPARSWRDDVAAEQEAKENARKKQATVAAVAAKKAAAPKPVQPLRKGQKTMTAFFAKK